MATLSLAIIAQKRTIEPRRIAGCEVAEFPEKTEAKVVPLHSSDRLSEMIHGAKPVKTDLTLAQLFTQSVDSVFVKTTKGELLYFNEAFRRDFIAPYDGEPESAYLALTSELREISRYSDELISRNKRVLHFSYLIKKANGDDQRYVTTKIPVANTDGDIESIIGVSAIYTGPDNADLWNIRDFHTMRLALDALSEMPDVEFQSVFLACSGYPNKKIANELDISVRSVERYRAGCVKKLGVDNFTNVVRAIECLCDSGLMGNERSQTLRVDTPHSDPSIRKRRATGSVNTENAP